MTIVEMNTTLRAFLNRCYGTIEVKNVDYHPEGVPMLEVFRAAAEANITPQQVLWGHLRKQLSAVRTYVINRTLQSEPLDSRLTDVVNYAALLQFLEANYASLLSGAWTYTATQTTCEQHPSVMLGCGAKETDEHLWCDRCALLAWLHREAIRCEQSKAK